MSIRAAGEPVLDLDTVECSPDQDERLLVTLSGRWRGHDHEHDPQALLIVEVQRRPHRFPAVRRPGRGRKGRHDVWEATFALPSWIQDSLEGHTTVAVGGTTVEVSGFALAEPKAEPAAMPAQAVPEAADSDETQFSDGGPGGEMNEEYHPEGEGEVHEPETAPEPGGPGDAVPQAASPDAVFGPGAEALRAELQERAGTEARIRGELAEAKAELEARIANQTRLAEMHGELRGELERLRDAVGQAERQQAEVESRGMVLAAELAEAQQQIQELSRERDVLNGEVAELRGAVASGIVTADSATAEAAGLRDELARLGAELATARQQLGVRESGIDEAEALLAEARALTSSLREE